MNLYQVKSMEKIPVPTDIGVVQTDCSRRYMVLAEDPKDAAEYVRQRDGVVSVKVANEVQEINIPCVVSVKEDVI